MDKKRSINNIQVLDLLVDSQQFIGRQPILLVIFRIYLVLVKNNFDLFLEEKIHFRVLADSRYPQSFKNSIIKHFVHN
jgi:hypothetical protein